MSHLGIGPLYDSIYFCLRNTLVKEFFPITEANYYFISERKCESQIKNLNEFIQKLAHYNRDIDLNNYWRDCIEGCEDKYQLWTSFPENPELN